MPVPTVLLHKKIPRPQNRSLGAIEGDAGTGQAIASVVYYEEVRVHATSMIGAGENIKPRDRPYHDVDVAARPPHPTAHRWPP